MKNKERLRLIVQAIRIRREELNYSQEYMAFKMDMGQNCYSKIELGNSKLTVDRLLTICQLLELDIQEVLADEVKLEKVS